MDNNSNNDVCICIIYIHEYIVNLLDNKHKQPYYCIKFCFRVLLRQNEMFAFIYCTCYMHLHPRNT